MVVAFVVLTCLLHRVLDFQQQQPGGFASHNLRKGATNKMALWRHENLDIAFSQLKK